MYRIRLESGEETEFNSFEELSFGIVSGIVGPESEIFHERAGKWLPIHVHPEYKRAVGSAPPPPPAARETAPNGRSSAGFSELLKEPDPHVPVRSDRGGDDVLDLLTLLDLGNLESADSGKVQESAVEDGGGESGEGAGDWIDPADWIGEADLTPATEVETETEAEMDLGVEEEEPEAVLAGIPKAEAETEVSGDSPEPYPPTMEEAEQPEAPGPIEVIESLETAESEEAPGLVEDAEPSDEGEIIGEELTPAIEASVTDSADAGDAEPLVEDTPVEGESEAAEAPLDDVDYLGDMLDSGDVGLTSPALDAEEHHPDEASLEAPEELPSLEPEEPLSEVSPAATWSPEPLAELGDAKAESEDVEAADDEKLDVDEADVAKTDQIGDYQFAFRGNEVVEESPLGMSEAAAGDVESSPSVQEDSPEERATEVEATPTPAGTSGIAERRFAAPPTFDLGTRGAPEARGGLRDLLPFELPKPPVLGAIAGVGALVLFAGWMMLRPDQPPTAASNTDPDTAVVAPVTPAPPRPSPNLAAQRREYERAYAQIGSILEDEIRRSGINYLFSSSRFGSEGDMLAARQAITAARTAVTAYRAREDSIERRYPEADPTLKEPRVYAELTDDILTASDGAYALLLSHLDDYAIRNGSVTFTDSRVEAQYTRLVQELDRLLTLAGEAQGDRPPTLRRVFEAIDATRPPPLAIIAPPPPLPGIAPPSQN